MTRIIQMDGKDFSEVEQLELRHEHGDIWKVVAFSDGDEMDEGSWHFDTTYVGTIVLTKIKPVLLEEGLKPEPEPTFYDLMLDIRERLERLEGRDQDYADAMLHDRVVNLERTAFGRAAHEE